MDFFAGFSWPVPTAFAAAVAACRFEQGDVLYSSKRAYRAWDPVRSELRHHIQVLDPPRSTRAMTSEGDGTRFSANWSSSVQIELKDYRSNSTRIWRSTQGRLFSCLWQGDVSWLDAEGRGVPPPPLLARELHRALQERLETVAERFRVALPGGVSPRLLYLSAVDQASDASLAKASLVESQLASRFAVVTADLAPSRAGIAEAERYHPSLTVCCLALDTSDESAVREVLKKALYAPSKASKSGGSAERFALQRHGQLVIG